MKTFPSFPLVAVGSFLLLSVACGPKKTGDTGSTSAGGGTANNAMKKAMGKIESKSGSKVTGEAWFNSADTGKVVLTVKISGATPGEHAVHLHEKGDCSAPDAASAGGHWNPTSMPHGAPDAAQHHAGDYGNIKVGADGTGSMNLSIAGLTVDSAPATGVVGRALIVHEKADDMTTQPTGNAGGRVGCAVIQAAP